MCLFSTYTDVFYEKDQGLKTSLPEETLYASKCHLSFYATSIHLICIVAGLVAGIYAGFQYGMEKARGGKHDWVRDCSSTPRSNINTGEPLPHLHVGFCNFAQ